MENDPLPPGSRAWHYRASGIRAIGLMASAERRNIPEALKELTILLTPGGILGFIFVLWLAARCRAEQPPEFHFLVVVAISAVSLVFAYCMLVFITTYAFPLAAVIIAVTARAFVDDGRVQANHLWRRVCLALTVAGLLVSFIYGSSPFRTIDRDFQASCRDAARKLQNDAGSRIVTVGDGPYPERGVGWEAGYTVAYFTNRRIIALGDLPSSEDIGPWIDDIRKSASDDVLLWGVPSDKKYQLAQQALMHEYHTSLPIMDPALGEVGRVVSGRFDVEQRLQSTMNSSSHNGRRRS